MEIWDWIDSFKLEQSRISFFPDYHEGKCFLRSLAHGSLMPEQIEHLTIYRQICMLIPNLGLKYRSLRKEREEADLDCGQELQCNSIHSHRI